MKSAKMAGLSLLIWALVACPLALHAEENDCPENDIQCWLGVLDAKGAESMRAAMALGRLQAPEAVPGLVKKLNDDDEYMATVAVHALVKIGMPAVPALKEATKSKSARVRKYSGYALGRIGDGSAVKAISKLAGDPDVEVRKNAAISFGRLKDRAGILTLVGMLQDRSRGVRIEAIRAMGEMPEPKTAVHLVNYGLLDLDSKIAMEAAAVLVKIGPASAKHILDKYPSSPAYAKGRMCAVLGQLWADADPGVKKRIEDTLIRILENKDSGLKIRQSACVGLSAIGGSKVIAALKKTIKDNQGKKESADLVKAAGNAIARIEGTKKK
jgi:HEAT repeat protein